MTRTKQEQPTWTTRDGRALKIADMETSHIKNTVEFIGRKIEALESRLDALDTFDDCFSYYETQVRHQVGWTQKKTAQMRAELARRDKSLAHKIKG